MRAASVTDPHKFRSGRQFAASLGLRAAAFERCKERLGRISKLGDKYLRRLLVVGMTRSFDARSTSQGCRSWLADMLSRKPARVVTVALANKTARVIWRSWRARDVPRENALQSPDAKDNQQKLRSLRFGIIPTKGLVA